MFTVNFIIIIIILWIQVLILIKNIKLLLIDEVVWSWAMLNITAWKLKESWVKEVIWFSFVWSLDLSYEVINEI